MANARGKAIDTTHLSVDQAEERRILHRDLIAHTLRWSHVAKFMHGNQRYKTARVLDVGCGRDVPLARMLYSNRLLVKEYVGLDFNKHDTFDTSMFNNGSFEVNTFGRVDFASNQVWCDKSDDGKHVFNVRGDNGEDYFFMPEVFTCFECFEHIEPAHGRALLAKFAEIMSLAAENGLSPVLFLSTPNYNETDCAANHVSETKHEALGWLVEDVGLEVAERHGTFASIRDYRDKMFEEYPGSKAIYDRLAAYYDTNMLANVFAPLYPTESRNCLWRITLPTGKARLFPGDEPPCSQPWTSSSRSRELLRESSGAYDPTQTGVGTITR